MKRPLRTVLYAENEENGYAPGDAHAHASAAVLAMKADAPTINAFIDYLNLLEEVGGQIHMTAIRMEVDGGEWECKGFFANYESRDAKLIAAEGPEERGGIPITDEKGDPTPVEIEQPVEVPIEPAAEDEAELSVEEPAAA